MRTWAARKPIFMPDYYLLKLFVTSRLPVGIFQIKSGKRPLLAAFVFEVILVVGLLLIMTIGVWLYTAKIIEREQALVTRILPEMDLVHELTAASANLQSHSRLLRTAQNSSELQEYRERMDTIVEDTQRGIAAMQKLGQQGVDELNTQLVEVRQIVDGLTSVRFRQLSLAAHIKADRTSLIVDVEALEEIVQQQIIASTDQQIKQSDTLLALESEEHKINSEHQQESLSLLSDFEGLNREVQNLLLLNRDLIGLKAVIEKLPLLLSDKALAQTEQQRNLFINALMSRIIDLSNSTEKKSTLLALTQLRDALNGRQNIFSLQQTLLILNADQQALDTLLGQYANNVLLQTSSIRGETRDTLNLAAQATLEGLVNYRNLLFVGALVLLFVLGWVSYGLLYRKTVVPLLEISSQLRKVGSTDFASERPDYAILEIAELSDAVFQLDNVQKSMNEKDALLRLRNDELRRVNEDLEQFAHVASHDLQEPLRKLQQFSDLVVEDYQSQLDDDGKFFLHTIKNSAERMSTMIKDTLAYARTAKIDQTIESVNLEKLLQYLEQDMDMAVRDAQANITYQNLPTLMANSTGMDQLFRNLLISGRSLIHSIIRG